MKIKISMKNKRKIKEEKKNENDKYKGEKEIIKLSKKVDNKMKNS